MSKTTRAARPRVRSGWVPYPLVLLRRALRAFSGSAAGAASIEHVVVAGTCSLCGLLAFQHYGAALNTDLRLQADRITGPGLPSAQDLVDGLGAGVDVGGPELCRLNGEDPGDCPEADDPDDDDDNDDDNDDEQGPPRSRRSTPEERCNQRLLRRAQQDAKFKVDKARAQQLCADAANSIDKECANAHGRARYECEEIEIAVAECVASGRLKTAERCRSEFWGQIGEQYGPLAAEADGLEPTDWSHLNTTRRSKEDGLSLSGFDDVMIDEDGNVYIVEYKGREAELDRGPPKQMSPEWVDKKLDEIEAWLKRNRGSNGINENEAQYQRVKDFYENMKQAQAEGRLRGRVYRTSLDEDSGFRSDRVGDDYRY